MAEDWTLWLVIVELFILIFTAIGLLLEYRKRRQEQGYNTYIETAKNFIESERLVIERKELRELYNYIPEYIKLSDEDKVKYHYCSMLLMTFEIVWQCHKRGYFKQGIIRKDDDTTWDDWRRWLEDLTKSNDFQKAWDITRYAYSKEFQNEVDSMIKDENK